MRFSNDLLTMSLLRRRRSRLRDFSCIPWLPPALERRTRPDPDTRNRLEAARFVFILGTVGSLCRALGGCRALPARLRTRRRMALGGLGEAGGESLKRMGLSVKRVPGFIPQNGRSTRTARRRYGQVLT